MIHPSYTELMKVINGDSEDEKVISSRYSVVLASAKSKADHSRGYSSCC